MRPYTLCIHGNVQTFTIKFGIAPTWFYRVHDNAIVPNLQFYDMSGLVKFCLGFCGVPHFPVKGQVARRLVVDIEIPLRQRQLHGQFIIVKFDQFGRITGLLHCFGNNYCNGFTNVADAINGQQRTLWFCPSAAIAIFDNGTLEIHRNTCINQFLGRDYGNNAFAVTRITDVEIGDHSMCNGRAEHKRMKRICRRNIIYVLTKPCKKALILNT